MPKRTRLFAKDFILDIVEATYGEKVYYYTVHKRSSGEIVTLGHEATYDRAYAAAVFTFRHMTGEELVFEKAADQSSAAS